MKLLNHFNRTGALFLFGMATLFYSCENQRTERIAESPTTEETADTFEGTGEDLESRRERLTAYMQNQINRIQSELDSLRQELSTATVEEKNQIEIQIGSLENDIKDLEQQQRNLTQADVKNLEQIERMIYDWVETQDLDRSVRGEGTSLDGPDLNRTGTRTGTEIETNVPVEIEETGAQNPAVPSGP